MEYLGDDTCSGNPDPARIQRPLQNWGKESVELTIQGTGPSPIANSTSTGDMILRINVNRGIRAPLAC